MALLTDLTSDIAKLSPTVVFEGVAGKITSDILESRLKCRYKGYLKMAREQGIPTTTRS